MNISLNYNSVIKFFSGLWPSVINSSWTVVLMRENKEKIKEMKTQGRHSRKEMLKRFLVSEEGIPFLINNVNKEKRRSGESCIGEREIQEQMKNIVDYYSAWVNQLPVKKNSRTSKYDLLKNLEDSCSRSDVRNLFDFFFI